ncbi:PREDICTED: inositol 1,4,5-trisphosphate receptor type 3-like isoform X2 [Amphimedon queenslandica]|uniref:Ion transport domain-containing protein n=1 Tax=Amphimedon queenslandica TaxID=400682 RepID=A0AAN0JCQ7_AMPQE|nr:PREDICTED: inositol 1,4,5-trisphosphate receptor type 3-like isoform X2 [Amphimedon queenslandica]|eukprot:XP_019854531.1 PREDICTED: inositol 1,4,5-trisphosphate receptor type 3-like isoform X2 [Amphimedon queenslandica]
MEPDKSGKNRRHHVHDGDVVLLLIRSPDKTGYVYSEPLSSSIEKGELTISSQPKSQQMSDQDTGFINDFALFRIIHGSLPNDDYKELELLDENKPEALLTFVYGSTVKLCHYVSGRYLTVSNKKDVNLESEDKGEMSLFRIVPPHKEKGWGKSLMMNDGIKLESILHKGTEIKFRHNPDEICYRPALGGDGTVFSVEPYSCMDKLSNPQTIKRGSIVMLAGTKIDGYLSATGSLVSRKLPTESQDKGTVSLRRWRKGFFNTQPFSGDTFFQLEKEKAEIFKGDDFALENKCRIKHLLTQQYISLRNGKIVVQEGEGEVFSIGAVDTRPKKVLQFSDQVIFYNGTKSDKQKCLCFDVEKEKVSDIQLVLGEEKTLFKLIKVDNDTVADVYEVMGMTLTLEKFLTTEVMSSRIIELMKGLQASFNCSLNKTRLANMLRTLKMIDVLAVILSKINQSSQEKQDLCSSICTSLLLYVKNGSLKSLHYLTQKKLLLDVLLKLVGRKCGAENVLITFFNGYPKADSSLLQGYLLPLIQAVPRPDPSAQESDEVNLLSTLAFNVKWMNWEVQEKTAEKVSEMFDSCISAQELIQFFKSNGRDIEKSLSSANSSFSTFIKVDKNEKFQFDSPASANSFDDVNQAIKKLNEDDFKPKTDYHAVHIQALIAITFLIDFGVINNCNKVVQILIAVLNGKQPTDDHDSHHDPVALKMKALALMSLKSLLRWNVNTSIKKLCQDFNCLRKKCQTASLNDNIDNSDGIELPEVVVKCDRCPPPLMSELVGKSELRKELTGVVQYHLRGYCSQNSIFDIDKDVCKQLCSSLIVLVNHDDAELRLRSIELLYSIYSLEEMILAESAERAYFTYEECEVHSSMKQLATMTDKEQLLRQVFKREITSQNLLSELKKLSEACVSREDKTEPNIVNQEAAYSCGLFDVLLDIVLEPKVSSDDEVNEEILKSCFIVLQKIARKNKRVQSKLFTSLYDFLEVDTAVSEMIHLLNEMFSNNCKQLYKKLSLADISHIFHIALTSSNNEHYELTVTLRIIIENTSLATPVQEHIAQLIADYKTHTLKQLLGNFKLEQLKDCASHNTTPHLLLNVTDLMASCATGECQHAESISSQIYSIDELLSILTSKDIKNDDWKLPFIRVLTWTYLFTERDSASDCLNLASNNDFWELLKDINPLIKKLLEQIVTMDSKNQLKIMNKSYWNTYALAKENEEFNKEFADTCRKLLFVIEGVIPLLSGFCREMSVHSYKNQLKDEHINILTSLAENLMKFMEKEYFTQSILEQLECCNFLDNLHQLGICKEVESLSSDSNSMPHRNETECAVINRNFQAFIMKYSKAYFSEETSDDMQKSLSIPKEPSFEKLLELFMDTNFSNGRSSQTPKILTLIPILQTLVQKQKELGLHCLERTNLEKMTVKTLQLICGIVYKKISQINSQRNALKPDEFQKQCEIIVQPLQKILLCEENGFVMMLLDLLQHPISDITFQVLACFNVLLYPGNHEAQQKITICINQHDQNFILCISQILTEAQLSLTDSKKLLHQPPQLQSLLSSTRLASLTIMDSDVDDKIIPKDAGTAHSVDYRITMALDVLIWLCDGQQKTMQDALSGNKLNGSNIVCQVAFLLLAIVEDLNDAKIIIAQKAVQALIEMCAGSYSNQSIACKGQAIVSINAILEADFKFQDKKFQQLKCSSMELLEILLEEIDERSPKLAHVIVKQLHVSHVLEGMLQSWKLFSKGKFIEESRNSLFRAYHSLKRIASYKNESINTLVEYEKNSLGTSKFKNLFGKSVKDAKRMWEHCESWSNSVEINYKTQNDKVLTRAFFPYDPHNHLNEHDKKTILLHIKRGTPQEKLFDLLKWTDAIKSDKKAKKNLSSAFRWLFIFSTGRHFALFWLTLLMNLIVLFSLSAPITSNFASGVCEDNGLYNETCNSTSPMYFQPIYSPEAPVGYYPLLYILGSIHALLSLWMALQYFLKNRKNIRIEMLLITRFKYKLVKGLLRRKKLYQVVNRIHQLLCRGPIRNKRPKPAEYFQIFLFSFHPIYRILFVLFSIAGLATHGYFYCGCLIYLFLRNDVMLYIVRALKRSAFQLITVFLLCVVIIYIYAVFSFALLQNYFSNTKDEFCNTLFECFVTVSRLGLLTTLGTALDIRPSSDYQPNFSLLGIRAFYDIVFYIVVTTLGLNIVIAILVDSFSDMRQENDEVENDNKTKCLICNIEKDKFERQNKSFQKHHDEDHNVWNYIHYILYLDSLHANDYNAIEKYVSSQVANEPSPRSITFFPLDKAKSLPNYQV